MSVRIEATMKAQIERVLQTTREYFAAELDAQPAWSTDRARSAPRRRLRDGAHWVAEFDRQRRRQRECRIARSRLLAAA